MVLLAVALQSGCGVVEAIEQVAAVAPPPAGAELSVVAAALRWGVTEDEAWREVSAAWARTAMALRLAQEAGVAPSSLLLSGSEDLRSSRLAEIDVAAARLGVRLVVPLGVAFLPAFVLTTIVPVVLALARQVLRHRRPACPAPRPCALRTPDRREMVGRCLPPTSPPRFAPLPPTGTRAVSEGSGSASCPHTGSRRCWEHGRRRAASPAPGRVRIAWVGLDLQHGDLGLDDVVPLLRVAERAGVAVLPRLASHAGDAIGKVVDAGVQGVIVPGVESADEARALVRAIRLPPAGGRSTGAARTSLGVTDGAEPLLLPMVETAAGLAAAAEIAAVPGVDGIFIGPYDLSMSLGCQPGEEPVMSAIASVVETVRAAGKIVGMFTGRPDLLALAQNLDLIGVDTDVTAVRRGIADLFV